MYVIMQKAKIGDDFVWDIKKSTDPAVILAYNHQLDDLVRFCATPVGAESLLLTVDPTFCLGEFECTPTTYQQLLLATRKYAKPPIFLGPCLVHNRKNFASYLFFHLCPYVVN